MPVVDARGFTIGVLPVASAREALEGPTPRTAADLARKEDLVLLLPDDDLQHALHALSESRTSEAVVVESPDAPRPLGVVTRESILDAWHRANT
jgi:CBS domain-containing protein